MAKTKNHRWLCPYCNTGKMAPSRLRKIDARRYCFPCSEKAGTLVERISPALAKKKRALEDKAKAKRLRATASRQKKAEVAAERWKVEGEDLNKLLTKYYRLAAWRQKNHKSRRHPHIKNGKPASRFDRRGKPIVNLRRSKKKPKQVTGSVCRTDWEINLTIGVNAPLDQVKLNVLWCLTNLAYNGEIEDHGQRFVAAVNSVFKTSIKYHHFPVKSAQHYWREARKAVNDQKITNIRNQPQP